MLLCFGFVYYEYCRLPNLIYRVYPSVVYIEANDNNGAYWSGSGIIVHKRGLILTAKHLIENAINIIIFTADGEKYTVINWILDPNNDIAIIETTSIIETKICKFDLTSEIGDSIFTIGSPYGLFNTVNKGIISNKERFIPLFGSGLILQLDIACNPGSSGGPVFDVNGDIIGIIVGVIIDADGIVFAEPASACKKLVDKYVSENP